MSTADLQHCGRYQLREALGEGAMGTVYRGWDPLLDRLVAIKVIQGWELTEDNVERFRREARTLARLPHPNIVAIHDVGTSDGDPFIVMELVEGPTLARVIADRGVTSFEQKVRLIAEVCDALACAHHAGIVHRDVKPGNILLSPSGTAKLADFGIARLHDSTLTATAAILGSPAYLAPESCGGGPTDHRVDVYGVAACLYEWLGGARPHEADNVVALVQKICNEDPVPLSDRWLDCPPSLERCVHRGLARNPAERYQSAAEFAQALREILGDSRVRVTARLQPANHNADPANEPVPVASERTSRRWMWLALVAMVILLVIALWPTAPPPLQQSTPTAGATTASPEPTASAAVPPAPVPAPEQRTRAPVTTPTNDIAATVALSQPAPESRAPEEEEEAEDAAPPAQIPIGSLLRVRLRTELRTDRSQPGHAFDAELAEPLVWNGRVVAPAETSLKGLIDEVHRGGGGRPPSLRLSLTDLLMSDRSLRIRTARYEVVAPTGGEGQPSITTLIVSAAAGAITGAATSGARGALAGAVLGASSAETTRSALAPGQIVLSHPLTFKLAAPLVIR